MDVEVPKHTVFREIDGKAIALNLDTGEYYSMNEMATRMWMLLEMETPPKAIVAVIEAEYDVDIEQVERDLKAFVEDLLANGLVEKV